MTSKRGKNDFLELVKTKGARPPQPPHLLSLIHQHMVAHCERTLSSMFLACDDAFYDLSQRSTNSDENLYFEAMRKVRIAKQGIIQRFNQGLAESFRRFANGDDSSDTQMAAQDHKLAIVDSDQLEVDLALKNMTSRVRDIYREPLYQLHMRLNHLLLRVDDSKAESPLEPERVALTFIEACSNSVDLDIKVRLILFKQFEEHVLKQMAPIYTHANQLLSEAGVLPKVPRQLNKDEARATPRTPEQPEHTTAESVEPATSELPGTSAARHHHQRFNMNLDTLVSLMTASRQVSATGTAQAAVPVVNCFIVTAGNPGPVMSAPQLSALLSRAQLVVDRQLSDGPKNIVPDLVNKLLRKADAKTPQALEETDEAVINLVSLFFDQILTDDNLPLEVYALVCRLQIPILKIALQDPSFFSKPEHPAREFINSITEAGVAFDETKPLERDPIYRKIADLVHTVTREPKVSEQLFEQAYQELRAAIRAEQRRFSLVEKRTSQSAAGRSRIRCAKRHAQDLLYNKLCAVELPAPVNEFLTTAWLQVLIITQLKHGHASAEWDDNSEIAEDLIWLCQRHQDVHALQRRERLLPVLLERVEAGLEAAVECPQVRADKIGELRCALEQLCAGSADSTTYSRLTEHQLEALGQRVTHQERKPQVREPDAPASATATEEALSPDLLDKARSLTEGTWVEYHDERTGRRARYKLAVKVDSDDVYVFVNRMGFRTLERSCVQLARDIQCNRIKPLPASEFFDRMMNKVLSRISHAA